MTRQIVISTRNEHKRKELERILLLHGFDYQLLSVADFPGAPEVDETEDSFVGNALLKARALAEFTGLAAIADDSGLCVDALDGAPGVRSARWSGATSNVDEANLKLVLNQIENIPDEARTAQFVCAAVYVQPDGVECVAQGSMKGWLTRHPRGTNGFGYDPIFVSSGQTQTNAELSSQEKDAISHRGQALQRLVEMLPHD